MTKEKLIKAIQASINAYGGEHGKVQKLFDYNIPFEVENCQGCISWDNAVEVWIVFRGSDESKDWKDNLQFGKAVIPYENTKSKIRVHDGFIELYKKVRKQINNVVLSFQRITITGHSLGGALATLCAVDMQYQYPDKIIECIPIASPRVGNGYFADSYNKRVPETYRIVYNADMVCKVPFPIMGFRHVNKLVQIGSMPKILCDINMIGNPLDHYPEKYLIAMKKSRYML